ncbi:MAG: hypothetical protein KI790_16715 [Cyclobacteriaceae bacterium]|nr:hypothetical protein [Cyclobacteriaceae bacterium HetDA_MAG_MS6]
MSIEEKIIEALRDLDSAQKHNLLEYIEYLKYVKSKKKGEDKLSEPLLSK